MAQLALSWIRQASGKAGMPTIIPISGTTKATNAKVNAEHIDLKEEDVQKFQKILYENGTIGDRGYAEQKRYLEG